MARRDGEIRQPGSRGADLAEIERVYENRHAEYVRVAYAIIGDRERALDAVQDAFASVVRKRRDWRGTGSLDAWIWRIVLNHSRNASRASRPDRAMDDRVELSTNGRAADAEVRAALVLLPERQRLALFLRYYADLDYRTIAATLGIAPGTVGSALSAARERLRDLLGEEVST